MHTEWWLWELWIIVAFLFPSPSSSPIREWEENFGGDG